MTAKTEKPVDRAVEKAHQAAVAVADGIQKVKEVINKADKPAEKKPLKLVDVKLKPVTATATEHKVHTPHFKQEARFGRRVITSKAKLSEVLRENVSVEEFGGMTSGLVVMGNLLEPAASRLANKLVGGGFRFAVGELDEEDPFEGFGSLRGNEYFVVDEKDETPFAIYRFTLNNKPITVMLDPTSKVWIGSETSPDVDWELRDEGITREGPINVLLKNSIAIDCHFFDGVTLVNTIAKESVLQNSIVARYEQNQLTTNRIAWNGRRRYHYKFKKDDRCEISNCLLTHMTIDNSDIQAGSYYSGIIRDSIIECPGQIQLYHASVYESTVKANGRLFLGQTSITAVTIESKGNVRLCMPSLRDIYLRTDGIYARNKFAITVIDVPNNPATECYNLVRINQHEVELSIGHRTEKKLIKLGTEQWQLSHELHEWLRKHDVPEANETKGSPDAPRSAITESIQKYVVDTIISRIGIINLLDDAVHTARNLERKDMSRHFHRYF